MKSGITVIALGLLLATAPLVLAADDDIVLESAKTAINEQRYEEALDMLTPLAENGNASAQNMLGVIHLQGWGVKKDPATANQWFEKAAGQGDAFAAFNLSWMYAQGQGVPKDCDKALEILLAPAEAGNPVAQVNLGSLYADGSVCTPQNFDEALRWYRAAADQGDPIAQHSLGAFYANGSGVPQDYAEAMTWYRKAADQGYADSQAMLGWMYEFGEGVDPDEEEALGWYRLAAEQGNDRARQRLQYLETGRDSSGVDAKLLATYLAAPAQAVGTEYNRVNTVMMMMDIATTVHLGDLEINDENREQVRADFAASLAALKEAMQRRGASQVSGNYTAKATKSCSKIQSMWAGGLVSRQLGAPRIVQEGNEFRMLQKMKGGGKEDFETPGLIVEDVMVFADPMNSDYLLVGRVSEATIRIAPDADFILSGWPDWVRAPARKDLDGCEVTLTRK